MTSVDKPIYQLLAGYPRTRVPLPESQAKIYVEEYKINRGVGGGILYRVTAALESWMHKRVASQPSAGRLLELGAGTLNHLRYETNFTTYDIIEPSEALLAAATHRNGISHFYSTIADVPSGERYDRIFSIAVLEHLESLPAIVAASGLLLAPGGVFQAGVPAEGGFVWGAAWRLTTGIAYRLRTGLAYAPVMRHEHVNDAADILAVLRHFFKDVRVQWFPLPARHLAFYGTIEAREPDLALCRAACRDTVAA